jgi:hypothetical protein
MERRSVGAMAGGIAGISAGGILLFSTVFVLLSPSCTVGSNGFTQCSTNVGALIGVTVAGFASLALGIPLLVYGAKKVPAGTSTSDSTLQGALPQWAGAPVGAGGLGTAMATPLRWSF